MGSHYKDKMVSWPFGLDKGHPYTCKEHLLIERRPRQFQRWYSYCLHNDPASWKDLSQNVTSCGVGFHHDISGPIHNSIEITILPASQGYFLTSGGWKQNSNGSPSSDSSKFAPRCACRWPNTSRCWAICRHSEDYEVHVGNVRNYIF